MREMIAFALAALAALPVFGHHSDAGIDMSAVATLQGTVTEFSWRNPHVYFTMDVTDDRSETVEWQVQMGSSFLLGYSQNHNLPLRDLFCWSSIKTK